MPGYINKSPLTNGKVHCSVYVDIIIGLLIMYWLIGFSMAMIYFGIHLRYNPDVYRDST